MRFIYLAPKVEYRGGVLRRLTEKNEVANKIQAFMLFSEFSKDGDIIALYPVKKSSSEMLKKMTLNIIKILTDVGYTIASLICDTHHMNRGIHLESDLSLDPTNIDNKHSIRNPFSTNQKMFMLFDSVHLFKSIRNNWLNTFRNTISLCCRRNQNFLHAHIVRI
nr:unnamed protein product [Callosobruchus analis]